MRSAPSRLEIRFAFVMAVIYQPDIDENHASITQVGFLQLIKERLGCENINFHPQSDLSQLDHGEEVFWKPVVSCRDTAELLQFIHATLNQIASII